MTFYAIALCEGHCCQICVLVISQAEDFLLLIYSSTIFQLQVNNFKNFSNVFDLGDHFTFYPCLSLLTICPLLLATTSALLLINFNYLLIIFIYTVNCNFAHLLF